MYSGNQCNRSGSKGCSTIRVQPKLQKFLFGDNGATIAKISKKTNVEFILTRKRGDRSSILLIGEEAAIISAKEEVMKIIDQAIGSYPPPRLIRPGPRSLSVTGDEIWRQHSHLSSVLRPITFERAKAEEEKQCAQSHMKSDIVHLRDNDISKYGPGATILIHMLKGKRTMKGSPVINVSQQYNKSKIGLGFKRK